MSEQVSSETLCARLLRQSEMHHRDNVRCTVPFYMTPEQLRALVECAERLKLVIAADDQAVAELTQMGLPPTDSEYFSLMDGNRAAIAKLESL